MGDQTDLDLDSAVAAFVTATAEQREAAVALDRYRIGAWLRERGHADLARAIEHGDHLDDDQPPIPSLRLVMAALNEATRRADAAEAEVRRLRDLVQAAYLDGWDTGQCRAGYGNPLRDWSNSSACAALGEPR